MVSEPRGSCDVPLPYSLMISYKSAMTDAHRNRTVSSYSSNTSENILPIPNPRTVSTDSYSYNSTLYLTATKLNEHNYLQWAQSVKYWNLPLLSLIKKMAIQKFSCYGLAHQFHGTFQWKTPPVSSHCSRCLGAVQDLYSNLENFSQIFELIAWLWKSKQNDREVTSYYNELVTLWQELDHCYDDVWKL